MTQENNRRLDNQLAGEFRFLAEGRRILHAGNRAGRWNLADHPEDCGKSYDHLSISFDMYVVA